ncbi:probable cytochrome P450 4ac1 [Thrips palmi]|uniref:Probable cytochrome P450 4ac1 n=1 Tax=Thrips palmi TaxID=161013 RepID=A0A6P8Z5G7_THRPL|nr:probable cytochrome P450 4ac1 [Thrips palmi]
MAVMEAATAVLLAALAACIVALVLRAVRDSMRDSRGGSTIPVTPGMPVIGHAWDFIGVDIDMLLPKILEMIDGRPLSRFFCLGKTFIVVSDATYMSEVVRRKDLVDKAVFGYNLMHVVAKQGLVQLGGAEWKQHRTWLVPGFKKKVLDSFIGDFNAVARHFLSTVPVGEVVEARAMFMRTMSRAFITTALGDAWDREEEVKTATDFIDQWFDSIMKRAFRPLLWLDWTFLLTADGRSLLRAKVNFDAFTKRFMDRKRQALRDAKHEDTPSEQVIQDEVKTFFFAAVETTASALSWAVKVLSLLPDEQRRVHAELDEVFGDSDRDVGLDDITKLHYLVRFIKEVMRMFPPALMIGRQCYHQTELWGYQIPANTVIGINILGIHRDAKHWPEPDRFDPDRFLPENSRDRHPHAYIPFSAGGRNCIGGAYAMQIMTVLLASVLRALSVQPVDDGIEDLQGLTDRMTMVVMSRLRGGFNVRFCSRVAGG